MFLKLFQYVFVMVGLLALSYSSEKSCGHDRIMKEKFPERKNLSKLTPKLDVFNVNMTVNEERRRINQGQPTNFKPIRIDFYYSLLDYSLFSKADKDFWLNVMFPSLKSYFEKLFKVFPLKEPIQLKKGVSGCWNEYIIKEDVTSNSDLFILLTNENNSSETYVAWASHCSLDSNYFSRPTLGIVNINLAYMNCTFDGWTSCFETMAHEMIHIFGLNSDLYDNFVDGDGNKLAPSQVYEQIGTKFYIKLDMVVKWARIHFNCSTVTNVLLEDEGGGGSAGSHWEASILREELMNPMVRVQTHASNFTLNFLEATGWYVVNFDLEQRLTYGRNAGCNFLSSLCSALPKPREFDCISGNIDCQLDYTSVGYCTKHTFSNGCYMNEGNSDYHCYMPDREILSSYLVKQTNSKMGEKSSCLKSTIKPKYSTYSPYGAGCYQTNCYRNSLTNEWILGVKIGTEEMNCTSKNQYVTPTSAAFTDSFSGSIQCPDIAFFCSVFSERCYKDCNYNEGYCAKNNICYYFEGLKGCSSECKSCVVNAKNEQFCYQCKPGYFFSQIGLCSKCLKGCDQCEDSVSCLVCNQNFTAYTLTVYDETLKSNKLIKNCAPICSLVLNNAACTKCEEANGNYICTECLQSSYLDLTGSCQPCSVQGCLICNRDGSCKECNPSHVLNKGACRACIVNNCELCAVAPYEYCARCEPNMEFFNQTNRCEWKCQDPCKNCSSLDLGSCNLCKGGFYLQGGYCKDCSKDCQKCNSYSECEICGNYSLLINGACLFATEFSSAVIQSKMLSIDDARTLMNFVDKSKANITNQPDMNSKLLAGLKNLLILSNNLGVMTNIDFLIDSISINAIPDKTYFFTDLDNLNRAIKEISTKVGKNDFNETKFTKTLKTIQKFEEYFMNESALNYSASQIKSFKDLQSNKESIICLGTSNLLSSEYYLSFESRLFIKTKIFSESSKNMSISTGQEIKRRVLLTTGQYSIFIDDQAQQKLKEWSKNTANTVVGIVYAYDPFYYNTNTIKALSLQPVLRVYYSSSADGKKIDGQIDPSESLLLVKLPVSEYQNVSLLSCMIRNDTDNSWSSEAKLIQVKERGPDYLLCESRVLSGFFRLEEIKLSPISTDEESIKEKIMNFGFYVSLLILCSFFFFSFILLFTKQKQRRVIQVQVTNNLEEDIKKIFGLLSFLRTKKFSLSFQRFCILYINLAFNVLINSLFYSSFYSGNNEFDESVQSKFIPISLMSFVVTMPASYIFGVIGLRAQLKDPKGNVIIIYTWFWALAFTLISTFCIITTWTFSFTTRYKNGAFLLASWVFTEFWKTFLEWLFYAYTKSLQEIKLSFKMFLMARGYFS